jgi:hypothetical protein
MEDVEVKQPLDVTLKASGAIAWAERRPEVEKQTILKGVVMAEPTSVVAAALGLAAKLFPPLIGAVIVIAVDPPKTRKELFLRFFVALTFSYLFGRTFFDFLKGFGWFMFLDFNNEEHKTAVLGWVGACGWFVMGGAVQMLRKFRNDPLATIEEGKKAAS